MSNVSLRGANTRLSYNLNGTHIAALRCPQLSIAYSINSEESHAKRTRAFYPHLRVQGTFAMRFEFITWKEFNAGMNWFRDYIESVINAKSPSPILVRLDDRNFVRLGVPTTGVVFGDHVGAMVFSPTINFVSVSDPRDTRTSIIQTKSASRAILPPGQISADYFYPTSRLNNPGALQQSLYDPRVETAAGLALSIQSTIEETPAPPQDHPQEEIPPQLLKPLFG